jgi:hypothetical protein
MIFKARSEPIPYPSITNEFYGLLKDLPLDFLRKKWKKFSFLSEIFPLPP